MEKSWILNEVANDYKKATLFVEKKGVKQRLPYLFLQLER